MVQTASGWRYRAVLDVASQGGRRRQVTRTFDTVVEARRFVSETRENVRRGTYLAPSRTTLRELTDEWLATRRDIRPVSVRGYRSVLDPICSRLGERKVQSLTRDEVEALVEWMRVEGGARGRGWSQRSCVYALGALRQVLDFGVSNGLLVSNPAARVQAPRRQRGDRRPTAVWEPADLVAFRRVADTDPWAAAWRLTLCGLRRSEVLGMSWSSVDIEAGTVKVEAGRVVVSGESLIDDPKSDASARVVPVERMHTGTSAVLRSLRTRQSAERLAAGLAYTETGLLLVDALGTGVSPDAYGDRFRAICRSAGVPVIPLHNVRHTLALMLHRAGEAPADVSALLGHTITTHLAHYVPRTERGVAAAAGRFGEVLATVR
jgi:integrase